MDQQSSMLHNKRAIVTGGGSGINLCLVKAFHERGVATLIIDLQCHREAAAWLAAIETKGPKTLFRKTDVTCWKQLESAFDYFASEFGGVPEIVVAGAGIYEANSAGFWDDRDVDSHYKLFDVNLLHPIKLTRIAIRRSQQAQKTMTVLHVSSIVAQKPSLVLPLYSVSKAAINQFVWSMASLEAKCGVRVVAVAPGVVDTPLFRDNPSAMDLIDMEKSFVLPPEEIVRGMLALLVDNRYPSGTVLEVGDFENWRVVQLLNDAGPQAKANETKIKTSDLLERSLKADADFEPI